jgi:hypothetical protein
MTHDELLKKIREDFFFTQGLGTVLHMNSCSSYPCHCSAIDETHLKLRNAMLSIVELHRPEEQDHKQYEKCWNCNLLYPCPTIQAIEKELT